MHGNMGTFRDIVRKSFDVLRNDQNSYGLIDRKLWYINTVFAADESRLGVFYSRQWVVVSVDSVVCAIIAEFHPVESQIVAPFPPRHEKERWINVIRCSNQIQ